MCKNFQLTFFLFFLLNRFSFRDKEKTNKTLETINMMKKLIINFTAAFNHTLSKDPVFAEMLENHRELVNIETILKMSRRNAEAENINGNAEANTAK